MTEQEKAEQTINDMQKEIDSLDMDEIILAVATDRDLKREIHDLILGMANSRIERGEKFKVTKRQFGLMVVLEGLIMMSASRESDAIVAASN